MSPVTSKTLIRLNDILPSSSVASTTISLDGSIDHRVPIDLFGSLMFNDHSSDDTVEADTLLCCISKAILSPRNQVFDDEDDTSPWRLPH